MSTELADKEKQLNNERSAKKRIEDELNSLRTSSVNRSELKKLSEQLGTLEEEVSVKDNRLEKEAEARKRLDDELKTLKV